MITIATPSRLEFDESGPLPDDPLPADIAAACLEIQAKWSSGERLRRMRSDDRPTYRGVAGEAETIDLGIYADHHAAHDAVVGFNRA